MKFKGNDIIIFNLSESLYNTLGDSLSKQFTIIRDDKHQLFHIKPCDLFSILEQLKTERWTFDCQFSIDFPFNFTLTPLFSLREYQQEAMKAWMNHKRGLIILPTGTGKSFLGLAIIAALQQRTLIVVPTLELVDQWYNRVIELLECSENSGNGSFVGKFGGGDKDLCPITITTYESGYLYLPQFREQFGFILFDEVHHLPGEKYRLIAEGSIAPYRLGLTATLAKTDVNYDILASIIGPIVYETTPAALMVLGHVAAFDHQKVKVNLTPAKYKEYLENQQIFSAYFKKFSHFRNPFQKIIFQTNADPDARAALAAYNRAQGIAFNAEEKLPVIEGLLANYSSERIIIFCQNIEFVERISRQFFIPALTSHTPTYERKRIMTNFRSGKYRIIVTGKILDEGVDIPQASIGIIVSGSSVPRQFVQRLGRILRPLTGKRAILYEILTAQTTEIRVAGKRSNI